MRHTILALLLTALTVTQTGCATGFRASGPRGGAEAAGAGVGTTSIAISIGINE